MNGIRLLKANNIDQTAQNEALPQWVDRAATDVERQDASSEGFYLGGTTRGSRHHHNVASQLPECGDQRLQV